MYDLVNDPDQFIKTTKGVTIFCGTDPPRPQKRSIFSINWVCGVDMVCGGRSSGCAVHVLGHLLDHGYDIRFHGDNEVTWAAAI
jgi:hypothetical protein